MPVVDCLDSVDSLLNAAAAPHPSPSDEWVRFERYLSSARSLTLLPRRWADVDGWFERHGDRPAMLSVAAWDPECPVLSGLDRRTELDRASHRYSANGRPLERNVTGCLDGLCGAFDANGAAQRMLRDKRRWRANKLYRSCNFDETGRELDADAVVRRIKDAWNETAANGTRLHEFIERWYKGEKPDARGISNENLAAFRDWEAIRTKNRWLLLASELPIHNEEWSLAGTVDALYVPDPANPRQVVLVDWKRAEIKTASYSFYTNPFVSRYAKSNYWKYALQLNLYREILEARYDLHVIEMLIVSFPERNTRCELIGVPRMYELGPFLETMCKHDRAAD